MCEKVRIETHINIMYNSYIRLKIRVKRSKVNEVKPTE